MEKIKDPMQIIANHGSMTSKECAQYFPELTPKVIDAKLRHGFQIGRLGRRLDETDSARRKRYVYFDVNGRASSLEPEYCAVLRTLGKPVESVDGIY
jgi:hypothetical protein